MASTPCPLRTYNKRYPLPWRLPRPAKCKVLEGQPQPFWNEHALNGKVQLHQQEGTAPRQQPHKRQHGRMDTQDMFSQGVQMHSRMHQWQILCVSFAA